MLIKRLQLQEKGKVHYILFDEKQMCILLLLQRQKTCEAIFNLPSHSLESIRH